MSVARRIVVVGWIIAVGLCGHVHAQTSPLWKSFHKARLFSDNEKLYAKADLVAGNIEYIADKKVEGYRAEKTVSVNGSISQKVYDYASNTSALLVFEDMRAELQRNHFEIMHQCEGISCGDLDAWRLYLSDYIAGDIKTQHYLLAKQQSRTGGDYYVQFYTVDINNKPRAVISVVKDGDRPRLGLVLNSDVLRMDAKKSLAQVGVSQVPFASGSAILTPESGKVIEAIAQRIRDQKITRLELMGHTDDRGGVQQNQALSAARAQAVAAALHQQPGLESLEIGAMGKGAANPKADNSSVIGRALNRRVDIDFVTANTVGADAASPKVSMQ